MKEKGVKIIWVMSTAIVLILGFVVMEASAVANLKLAITIGPQDSTVMMLNKFAELAKAKTGGSVEITVYHSGQLGNDQQTLQGVRLGTIDMVCAGIPWHTSFAPAAGVLNLPYLFKDYNHAYRVLDGEIGQELAGKFIEPHGIKVLGYPEIGFRSLSNSKKEVRKPEDVNGLKIRTTSDPYHLAAWKAWGVIPVPMPGPEIYMGLKTGTVDGQENPVTVIYGMKYYEVQKFISLTMHAYTAMALDMNPSKYQSLSPLEQKALSEALKEAMLYHRNLNRSQEGSMLKHMREMGTIITENPDRDAFANMVKSVYEEYTKNFGPEYLEKISKLR